MTLQPSWYTTQDDCYDYSSDTDSDSDGDSSFDVEHVAPALVVEEETGSDAEEWQQFEAQLDAVILPGEQAPVEGSDVVEEDAGEWRIFEAEIDEVLLAGKLAPVDGLKENCDVASPSQSTSATSKENAGSDDMYNEDFGVKKSADKFAPTSSTVTRELTHGESPTARKSDGPADAHLSHRYEDQVEPDAEPKNAGNQNGKVEFESEAVPTSWTVVKTRPLSSPVTVKENVDSASGPKPLETVVSRQQKRPALAERVEDSGRSASSRPPRTDKPTLKSDSSAFDATTVAGADVQSGKASRSTPEDRNPKTPAEPSASICDGAHNAKSKAAGTSKNRAGQKTLKTRSRMEKAQNVPAAPQPRKSKASQPVQLPTTGSSSIVHTAKKSLKRSRADEPKSEGPEFGHDWEFGCGWGDCDKTIAGYTNFRDHLKSHADSAPSFVDAETGRKKKQCLWNACNRAIDAGKLKEHLLSASSGAPKHKELGEHFAVYEKDKAKARLQKKPKTG